MYVYNEPFHFSVQVFSAPMGQILERLQGFGEFQVLNLSVFVRISFVFLL